MGNVARIIARQTPFTPQGNLTRKLACHFSHQFVALDVSYFSRMHSPAQYSDSAFFVSHFYHAAHKRSTSDASLRQLPHSKDEVRQVLSMQRVPWSLGVMQL
jgi:hypothetical protein